MTHSLRRGAKDTVCQNCYKCLSNKNHKKRPKVSHFDDLWRKSSRQGYLGIRKVINQSESSISSVLIGQKMTIFLLSRIRQSSTSVGARFCRLIRGVKQKNMVFCLQLERRPVIQPRHLRSHWLILHLINQNHKILENGYLNYKMKKFIFYSKTQIPEMTGLLPLECLSKVSSLV